MGLIEKEFDAADREIANLKATNADLLAALEEAASLIRAARNYFPRSIKDGDRFTLEQVAARIGTAIAKARGA